MSSNLRMGFTVIPEPAGNLYEHNGCLVRMGFDTTPGSRVQKQGAGAPLGSRSPVAFIASLLQYLSQHREGIQRHIQLIKSCMPFQNIKAPRFFSGMFLNPNSREKAQFMGLTHSKVTGVVSGNDLVLTVGSGNDVRIDDWNVSAANRLNSFQFTDGLYSWSTTGWKTK